MLTFLLKYTLLFMFLPISKLILMLCNIRDSLIKCLNLCSQTKGPFSTAELEGMFKQVTNSASTSIPIPTTTGMLVPGAGWEARKRVEGVFAPPWGSVASLPSIKGAFEDTLVSSCIGLLAEDHHFKNPLPGALFGPLWQCEGELWKPWFGPSTAWQVSCGNDISGLFQNV